MGKIKKFNDVSESYDYYLSDKNNKSVKVSKSDFIKAGIYNGMKSKNFKIDSDKKQVVAKFESFNKSLSNLKDKYDDGNVWLVYYSGGNGMGGEYEKFEGTEKEASDYCYQMACDNYDSYAGLHGIRDTSDIMEEDSVDEEEASEIYHEEREGSLDYKYEIYDDIKHSDLIRESVESLSKNPKVKTTLVGVDGNAFSLMRHFSSKAREQGWNRADINEVTSMAMEGDYNHLLRTLMTYIDDTHNGEDDDDDETCWNCDGRGCEECEDY